MFKLIYMTGAPAAGKSTTSRYLASNHPNVVVFEYGAELTKLIASRHIGDLEQTTVRQKSSDIVTENDVNELDRYLIEFVKKNIEISNIIIDSHPVTKESYGFRITPFSRLQIEMLGIDEVWALYAPASVIIDRIKADAGGRPVPTVEEAEMHNQLQGAVAAQYAVLSGKAAYIFDTSGDREAFYERLAKRLR